MTTRATWIDTVRLAAGISMIGVHASSDPSGQPFAAWEAAERVGPALFRVVVYMARTELFIIVSLFLLMLALDRRPRSYRAVVAEQSQRLLIPFVFWTLFFCAWRFVKADYFGYADALLVQMTDVWAWVGYFVLGDVNYHMHFLPTLFPLVLFLPLYKLAVRHPALGLAILVCLFVKRDLDVWLWSNFKDMDGFDYLIRAVKVTTYVGYGLVAASFYGLYKRGLDAMQSRYLTGAALALGAILVVFKFIHAGRIIETGTWQFNYEPAYWADFLMPVVLFAVCMGRRNADWPEIFSRLAPFSFGIYLVHPVFLDCFEMLTDGHDLSPSAMVAIKVAGALACTSVAVWAISKIPSLAWTIGLGQLPRLPLPHPLRRNRAEASRQ